MSCERYAHHDAAYVLGVLPVVERRDFEHHLDGCESCARSVRELAGMPGLLSRLEGEDVARLEEPEEVPPEPLAVVMARVARHRRRRAVWVAVGAVAAAVVLVLGTLGLAGGLDPERPGLPPAGPVEVRGTPMAAVDQDRLAGEVGLREVAWGTKVQLRCRYTGSAESVAGLPAYVLVLRDREGGFERVATWRAVAGKVATIDAATATPASQIAGVYVETVSGRRLLRLER